MIGLTLQIELVPKKADKLDHFESVRPCVFSGGGQSKVSEKILPGQLRFPLTCRGVLGIAPFGGAGVTIGRTFEIAFSLAI